MYAAFGNNDEQRLRELIDPDVDLVGKPVRMWVHTPWIRHLETPLVLP